MNSNDQKRVGDLTVAEARQLVRQGVMSGIKVWLLLALGIPAGIFAALALAGYLLYPG